MIFPQISPEIVPDISPGISPGGCSIISPVFSLESSPEIPPGIPLEVSSTAFRKSEFRIHGKVTFKEIPKKSNFYVDISNGAGELIEHLLEK